MSYFCKHTIQVATYTQPLMPTTLNKPR